MIEQIDDDLKLALKNQDKFTLSVLRMLKSEFINESRKGTLHELTDEEAQALKNTEPVLTGEGEADLKYGQWIYIFCDVNSETAEEPSKSIYTYGWSADFA